MDRKFKVSPGDEIIIRVPGKNQTVVQGKRVGRKGMIRARRPDDFLPRRLKKGGYLNFYDLGQIKIGDAFADVEFNVNPGHTAEIAYNPSTGSYYFAHNVARLNVAVWTELKPLLRTVPFPEFRDKYRKLEYASAFRYAVNYLSGDGAVACALDPTDEHWTESGLKSASSQIRLDSARGAFLSFGNTGDFKVTREDDFDAPAAEIDFKKNTDIFLMPALHWFTATIRPLQFLKELFTHYYLPSRSVFLERGCFNEANPSAFTTAEIISFFEYWRAVPEAKAYSVNRVTGAGGEISPANYPDNYPSASFEILSMSSYSFAGQASDFYSDIGTCHGFALQGNETFYFWRKAQGESSDFGVLDIPDYFV